MSKLDLATSSTFFDMRWKTGSRVHHPTGEPNKENVTPKPSRPANPCYITLLCCGRMVKSGCGLISSMLKKRAYEVAYLIRRLQLHLLYFD